MRPVIFLVLSLGVACARVNEASPRLPQMTRCSTVSDCGPELSCVAARCILPSDARIQGLHLALTPPVSTPYVQAHVLDIDLEHTVGPLDLVLPETIVHRVLAFDDRGGPPRLVNARLSLTATDRIPGQEQVLLTELKAFDPRTGSILLVPGEYEATLTRDDGVPSLRTRFTVRPNRGQVATKEFHFGQPRRIFGQVTSSLSLGTKLAGVRVTAFSTASGLASTSTVTGPDGAYAIDLPYTSDASFLLLATARASEQPAWGYAEVVIVPEVGDRAKNIELEPTSPQFQGTADLVFGGVGPKGFEPLASANVTLTAHMSVSTRVFRLIGKTDRNGVFQLGDGPRIAGLVGLLKAVYTAEIEPPAGSPFARTITTIDLTRITPNTTPEVQIEVPFKKRLLATASSELGPAAFASVQAQPLDRSGVAPGQTNAGPDGEFELLLDPGEYALAIRPRRIEGAPVLPVLVQRITISDREQPEPMTIDIPFGSEISGTVHGGKDRAPIAGTRAEVFLEVQGRAIRAGEATSASDGSLSIVLPRLE